MPNSHAPLAQHSTHHPALVHRSLYVFISQQIYMATYSTTINSAMRTCPASARKRCRCHRGVLMLTHFLVHSLAVLKNAALSFFNC